MSGSDPSGPERFRILASAVAGRSVLVAPTEAGEPPWTDGVTIFIDAGAAPGDQLLTLAVQASLLCAGSLDREILRQLGRRRSLIRRYLAIEGHRALAAQEAVLPVSVCTVIDGRVAARTDSPAASLAIASSRESIEDPPNIFGSIRPALVKTAPEAEAAVNGRSAPTPPSRRSRDPDLRSLDDDDDGVVLDILSSPIGGGGGIGRLLKKFLGDGRSTGGGPPGADAPTRWTRRGEHIGPNAVTTKAASNLPEGPWRTHERSGAIYPEWDVHRRRYRPGWCTVLEVEGELDSSPAPLSSRHHGLRRPLARLGTDLERRHRQLQGDDIDIDAAVEACVEAITGCAPGEALYIDSVRRRRDVAVLLLLDVSGSAGEPSAAGATVHEHQRAMAADLMEALHDIGDRVALYGFRSQGRSAVHVLPAKRFGEKLDTRVMRRLSGFAPGGYTRLGAAIRHGTAILERDGGTSRRLLVVLSDGFAYDHGYEGAYGEADARRALAEARRWGIGCLCISVGAATDPDALRRVFGTAAHAAIPRPEGLPGMVGPLFRSALRSAEVKRRISQRRLRTKERLVIERSTE